ncbi:MAG: 50S ribosomal protein L25 [Candidatus Hydrogenedentes bacterium]|nr:50S ribosomal protein L25 [Candidatus Hydrogenedentota bacterium]
MEIPVLKARLRSLDRKSEVKKMRREEKIPAVLYGLKESTVSICIDKKEFNKMLSHLEGKHPVVKLEIEDGAYLDTPALIQDIQRHPVRRDVIHVDFLRIRLDQKIHTSVPVVLVGQAEGVKMGGVLDHQLREIAIECLALQVPPHIELDVTNLGLGKSFHVYDLVPPEGVKIITDPERVIVSVHVPRSLESKLAEAQPAPASEESEKKEAGKESGKEEK